MMPGIIPGDARHATLWAIRASTRAGPHPTAPHRRGRVSAGRSDGRRRCILIKDEHGLYTADPKKDPNAQFIPEIDIDELLALDLEDLAVERSMLESLKNARSVREVFIVNGLVRGNIHARAGRRACGNAPIREA